MNRASLLCLLVGASAALSACDVPSATFGATGGSGGSGTTSTDGTGTTTSTMGSGGSTVSHPVGGGGAGADGGGGSGGATTSSTTTSSTTTTTTTATGAVVQCNFPSVSNCDPGEVCCFDKSEMMPVDFCGNPGSCQPQTKYAELQCENNDDCTGGKVCCAYYVLGADLKPEWQSMYCDSACEDDQEIETCKTNGDCTFPIPCDFLFGDGYPEYKGCFPL